jgi:hypothetical protein
MPRRLAPLDRTRHLDGTPEQQQLFGQGGLAGVRVGNDGERASFAYFSGTYVSQSGRLGFARVSASKNSSLSPLVDAAA